MKKKLIKNKKEVLYTACFLGLVIVDWLRSNTPGNVWAVAVNCGGLLLGVMLLANFRLRRLRPGALWAYAALWILGSAAGYLWWHRNPGNVFFWQYVTGALNAGWIGLMLLGIKTEASAAGGGGRFAWRRPGMGGILSVLWALTAVCMMFTPSNHLWVVWFFSMFFVFYKTELDDRDIKSLWDGMANGIILGFFVLQIYAYGFRPYDDVRYRGAYINCNMNALFYLVAYIMVLYRLHDLKLKELKLKSQGLSIHICGRLCSIFWYLLAGGLLCFIFFTLSRTALLAAVSVTVAFSLAAIAIYKDGPVKILKRWLILGLCFLIAFPAVYLTIRYLPTVLRHPVWMVGEYAETKVHSFDPVDSDKYVSLDEFFEAAFGRLNYGGLLGRLGSAGKMTVYAAPSLAVDQEVEQNPLLPPSDWEDSGKIRLAIYKKYWENLNLWGHGAQEGRFLITEGYFAWHAQNVFLQVAFFYGILAGIFFVIAVLFTGILAVKKAVRGNESGDVLPLLIWVVFVTFGMLEAVWNPGQLILLLFFIVQKGFYSDNKDTLAKLNTI